MLRAAVCCCGSKPLLVTLRQLGHGGNRKQIFPPQSRGTISGPSGSSGSRGLNNSYAIQSFKPGLLAAGVNRKDVPLAVRQENVTKLSTRVLEARSCQNAGYSYSCVDKRLQNVCNNFLRGRALTARYVKANSGLCGFFFFLRGKVVSPLLPSAFPYFFFYYDHTPGID